MVVCVASCVPLCPPGSSDCRHTLTGWRYQPDYSGGLVDNCPGEFPCGGRAMPIYEPDYGAMRAPQIEQSNYDIRLPHIDPDPSPMVTAPRGCPGIPLPGTYDCLLP